MKNRSTLCYKEASEARVSDVWEPPARADCAQSVSGGHGRLQPGGGSQIQLDSNFKENKHHFNV